MNPVTGNIEEQSETNRGDYIIGLLQAEDDTAISAHLDGIEGETLSYLGEEVRGRIIGEMGRVNVVGFLSFLGLETLFLL